VAAPATAIAINGVRRVRSAAAARRVPAEVGRIINTAQLIVEFIAEFTIVTSVRFLKPAEPHSTCKLAATHIF